MKKLLFPVFVLSVALGIPQVAGGQTTGSTMEQGRTALARSDFNTALLIFNEFARAGNAEAQFQLGLIYANGNGVGKDYAAAVQWFRLAADQGYAPAQFSLGVTYARGWGHVQNFAEAASWYRLAADQGYTQAQFNLGLLYYHGTGVVQNDAEATRWYRLAADQGFALSQYNLGLMYDEGRGVVQSFAEAVRLYRLAAEQGYAPAQHNLGLMYDQGRGVVRNHAEAARWYRLAADQGHVGVALEDIIDPVNSLGAAGWARCVAADTTVAASIVRGDPVPKPIVQAHEAIGPSLTAMRHRLIARGNSPASLDNLVRNSGAQILASPDPFLTAFQSLERCTEVIARSAR